jgi:hypothetical protein
MAEYESEVEGLLEAIESEGAEGIFDDLSRSMRQIGAVRFPPPKTPPRGGLRPITRPPGFVTRVELATTVARIDGKIGTVSEGIKTVNNRLNAINAEKNRADAALKNEINERKKDSEAQKKDFNSKVQMLALFPLLLAPTSYSVSPALNVSTAGAVTAATNPAQNTPLTVSPGQASLTNALLPILLIGGLGGQGGLGSSSDGGMDNTMLLVLALVLSQRP